MWRAIEKTGTGGSWTVLQQSIIKDVVESASKAGLVLTDQMIETLSSFVQNYCIALATTNIGDPV